MTRSRRALYSLAICALFLFTGCISHEIPAWGSDGIEVTIDKESGTATMSSHVGDQNVEDDIANLMGCDSEGNYSSINTSTAMPIRIEGWLHASNHFPDGSGTDDAGEQMSAAAVIIALDDLESASGLEKGRVEGIKWDSPSATVRALPPGQSSSSKFPHMGWAIVGLVPGNENVLEGFGGLDWNQKIGLKGWLLDGSYMGYPEVYVSDDGRCRIYAGANMEGFKGTMLVTHMYLGEHGHIDSDNSYNAYSVPILGTWLYTIVLMASVGGAVLVYGANRGIIRRGATHKAKELLTEAQMLAGKAVGASVKRVERVIDKEKKQQRSKPPREKPTPVSKSTKEENSGQSVDLGEFDIMSALGGDARPDARSIRSASSGGVVETVESKELDAKMEEHMNLDEPVVSESTQKAIVEEGTDVGSSTDEGTPKVRKTRAVKQKEEESLPSAPRNTRDGPDMTDDEDFSDFSL